MKAMSLCHYRFVKWMALQGDALQESGSVLKGKRCAVFGVGSSAYPRFCAAAESMRALLLAAGVLRMLAACSINCCPACNIHSMIAGLSPNLWLL